MIFLSDQELKIFLKVYHGIHQEERRECTDTQSFI